ncbi:endolytic transglycosylase MltG [Streptococcus catagoni]|uniref:endolytic transglycosylase MltG n=1 Tax=Streptococcus catagoni TaxID=2654874 RepID=UPI00140A1832|nr:endolytic transglycosylase MltG [Streptococcus catagoni]
MTDFRDDERKAQQKLSFKEQILAELERANHIRKEKEEELLRQDLKEEELRLKQIEAREAAQKTVQLYKEYQQEISNSYSPLNPRKSGRPEKADKKSAFSETSTDPNSDSKPFVSEWTSKQDDIDYSKTIAFTPINLTESETEEMTISQRKKEEQASNKEDQGQNASDQPKTATLQRDFVRNNHLKRQRADRMAKKISTILISSLLLILLLVALIGTLFVYRAINPVNQKDDRFVQVEIPAGSGNKIIGQVLEEKGLIKSSTVFNFYTKFKNYTNFQSGYYNLQKSMSLEEIAKTLQRGGTAQPTKPVLGKILIPEGYTIRQIAKAVQDNANTKSSKDKTPFKSKEFLDTIEDDAFIKEMVKKYPRLLSSIPKKSEAKYQLEGYLFPATYNYYKESSIKDVVDEMLATTDATLAPYYDKINASGKTVNEVLTLASLVEKEGSTDEDRRDIASVFYNRLNNGMALQSNIAILYAMDKLGDKTTLAEDAGIDTTIKSPYNIYTHTGLMPGPVDSPGVSAIDATVKPANTDYLYFVANVHSGEVHYAKTYEEHSANVQKYVNNQIE